MPPGLRELLRLRSYRVRLTIALAGFFILPTLVFSAWTVARLRADTAGSIDLVVQQTLSDAASAARRFETLPAGALRGQLAELADGLNADLLWYDGGVLVQASPAVLLELGLLDRYMPPAVFRSLILRDQVDVAAEVSVGGQPTRVGYRSVGSSRPDLVLAAPRLVDVQNLLRDQEDVLYGMALTALLGLVAAAGLAAVAARSLAMPVQSLRGAAMAVGRGVELPAFDPAMPTEFVPVVRAFERMARDVEASQAALEAARRRTVSVLQNVVTGVVAVDPTLRVTLANPRAEELLGSPLATGSPVDESETSEWRPVWAWVRRFIARGVDTDSQEFSVDERRVRVQAAAVHGDPGGAVVALDDTTELTRAVRVLAWGELAHQVAHEIKNPLTPIRLGIQHLQRVRRDPWADFDGVFERTARSILAEIERLDSIARAFARFGAPPAEAAPLASADLAEIVRDTAELYALGDGPTIEVESIGRVRAHVRRDEVKEVLVNLIENARDAGAATVKIAVSGDRGAPPTLVLTDDGRGIPPSDLPHVFEPRFSTTTSGTGLGLAICKRLVESWHGSIAVESELGRGTVVRVTLGGTDESSEGDVAS
jgi:nitrogen fixation/metabolism regulation signal transduction histidine kinase